MRIEPVQSKQPVPETTHNGDRFRLFHDHLEVSLPDAGSYRVPLEDIASDVAKAAGTLPQQELGAVQAVLVPKERELFRPAELGKLIAEAIGRTAAFSDWTVRDLVSKYNMENPGCEIIPQMQGKAKWYPRSAVRLLANHFLADGGSANGRRGPHARARPIKPTRPEKIILAKVDRPAKTELSDVIFHHSFSKKERQSLTKGWMGRPMYMVGLAALMARRFHAVPGKSVKTLSKASVSDWAKKAEKKVGGFGPAFQTRYDYRRMVTPEEAEIVLAVYKENLTLRNESSKRSVKYALAKRWGKKPEDFGHIGEAPASKPE